MKKSDSGFAHVEILLAAIIVVLLGLGGYYVYSTQAQLRGKAATTNTAQDNKPAQNLAANPRAFYDCVNANGVVSGNAPITCSLNGSTFGVPTVFDKSQINNLDKVPVSLQSQIITIAAQNFDSCQGDVPGYPDTYVTLAQANFVDIGVGCVSGYHTFFGLDGSTWTNLGSNQVGLKCSWVSTYQIHQSSLVTLVGSAGDKSCSGDGSAGQVPQ